MRKFVIPEKITLISNYFKNSESAFLCPAKASLEDQLSYNELRFVLKHMEGTKQI